jgi:hypothetical protein
VRLAPPDTVDRNEQSRLRRPEVSGIVREGSSTDRGRHKVLKLCPPYVVSKSAEALAHRALHRILREKG